MCYRNTSIEIGVLVISRDSGLCVLKLCLDITLLQPLLQNDDPGFTALSVNYAMV